jgi:hypothetical protein
MDINPEDETSCTTQHQEALLKYMVNEYCSKHRQVPVIKPQPIPSSNQVASTMASGSGQSFFDRYDLSSNQNQYLTPDSMAETTPGMKRSHSTLMDLRQALFEFTA